MTYASILHCTLVFPMIMMMTTEPIIVYDLFFMQFNNVMFLTPRAAVLLLSLVGPSASSSLVTKDESSRASDGIEWSVNTEKEFITNAGIFMSKIAVLPGTVHGRLGGFCGPKVALWATHFQHELITGCFEYYLRSCSLPVQSTAKGNCENKMQT